MKERQSEWKPGKFESESNLLVKVQRGSRIQLLEFYWASDCSAWLLSVTTTVMISITICKCCIFKIDKKNIMISGRLW